MVGHALPGRASQEVAEVVVPRTQALLSLLSLAVQSHGKESSIVGWEHRELLLQQGIYWDAKHGFLVEKTVMMGYDYHLLHLIGVCCEELAFGKLRVVFLRCEQMEAVDL